MAICPNRYLKKKKKKKNTDEKNHRDVDKCRTIFYTLNILYKMNISNIR